MQVGTSEEHTDELWKRTVLRRGRGRLAPSFPAMPQLCGPVAQFSRQISENKQMSELNPETETFLVPREADQRDSERSLQQTHAAGMQSQMGEVQVWSYHAMLQWCRWSRCMLNS